MGWDWMGLSGTNQLTQAHSLPSTNYSASVTTQSLAFPSKSHFQARIQHHKLAASPSLACFFQLGASPAPRVARAH